jgi:acetylornithine deacetylase
MLAAMKALTDSGAHLKGDVIVAAVADEEHGSIGTEALVKEFKPTAAIVAEPTDLDVCVAHKGFCVFEITTRGRAAHGARYMDGIDANLHMGRVLAQLDRHARQLLERGEHPLLGPPSLLVPLVHGGSHQFVYADQCRASVERRTLPGETPETVAGELQVLVARCAAGDDTFSAELRKVMSRNAYEISPEAEIVRVVTASAARVLGRPPAYIGHYWWEDAALIAEAGAETVIIGTKGGGIHAHEEWVDIESTIDLARVLANAAVSYCS